MVDYEFKVCLYIKEWKMTDINRSLSDKKETFENEIKIVNQQEN